jgi:dihydrofolate reductase
VPQTIVLAFSTLDGIIEDPDGRGGNTPRRLGLPRRPVASRPFPARPKLDTGVLLLGRKTWELFSHIWPGRTDDFSLGMNRMPKLVASRTRTDLSAWQNSSSMSGELHDIVERTKADRDVIIAGSASIVHALEEHDRVDEYRILIFPTALSNGTPLFSPEAAPVQLRLLSAEAQRAGHPREVRTLHQMIQILLTARKRCRDSPTARRHAPTATAPTLTTCRRPQSPESNNRRSCCTAYRTHSHERVSGVPVSADGSIWAAPWAVPAADKQTVVVQASYGLVPIGWVQSALRVLDDAPNQRQGARPRRGSASMSRSRKAPRTCARATRSWCSPGCTCRPATS